MDGTEPMTPLSDDWPDVSSDDRGPDVAPFVEFVAMPGLMTVHSWEVAWYGSLDQKKLKKLRRQIKRDARRVNVR